MRHEHENVPYQAVFTATPAPLVVLTLNLVICDANDAYLEAVGRSRDELIGQHIFDVFPQSSDSDGEGAANLRASFERARDTGRPDIMAIQRYDIPRRDGSFEERYWSPIQVPVLDVTGATMLLLHRAEDVTDFVRERQHGRPVRPRERDSANGFRRPRRTCSRGPVTCRPSTRSCVSHATSSRCEPCATP